MWQRIIKKIVKASIQVTMSAISTTRFLDPYSTSFLSKNAWGLTSWALILSGSRSARSTKSLAKIFGNKFIKDWSIARTHHKSFVEAWKRGGHRSGRASLGFNRLVSRVSKPLQFSHQISDYHFSCSRLHKSLKFLCLVTNRATGVFGQSPV